MTTALRIMEKTHMSQSMNNKGPLIKKKYHVRVLKAIEETRATFLISYKKFSRQVELVE